jgi:hypothetical protein
MTDQPPFTPDTQLPMKLTPNEILEQIASALNPVEDLNCYGDLIEELYSIMERHCPEIINAAELNTAELRDS